MKQFLFSLAVLFTISISGLVAQDNPCGVEGIVVEASSYQYAPSSLEIEAGQTVVWVNMGGFHDVNGVASSIGTTWNNPETFAFDAVNGSTMGTCIGFQTFTVEGTYDYDCAIGNHAEQGMVASVTVIAPPSNTVVDIIVNSEDHTLLEAAVGAAGLVDALNGDGPFTVFAPTDAAIVALTEVLEITAEELLALPNLGDILQYHVVAASAFSTDLTDGQMIGTLQGSDVTVTINMDGVFINEAMVTVADIAADNGVVHVIDAVLLPPAPVSNTVVDVIVNSEDHTVLEAAVLAADLAGALSAEGPFTVFAPTDAAFTALMEALEVSAEELLAFEGLTDVLLYHVVGAQALAADLSDGQEITTLLDQDVTITINGMGVFVNQAMVTVADIVADNGVVHVIDAVLLPELDENLPETVVDIIVASEVHTLLEAAVVAAGLVDALSGEGPFTVFAPTDDAIVALTEALSITAEELLALPNLGEILQYHVVAADAFAEDLSDGQLLTTLLGQDVTVSISDAGVMINDAMVIVADLEAENGVVHVIDAVLLPPASNLDEVQVQLECTVYPNPLVGGVLNVQGNWAMGAQFTITDLQGRMVAQSVLQSNQIQWDASGLESGVYAITVAEGVQFETVQFVIR
ncbi:fasciclin domain-containing protein [Flavobacteriales bacterium]|nr:fasciclin domain-containing protein [Flavobacteriales bacterium]